MKSSKIIIKNLLILQTSYLIIYDIQCCHGCTVLNEKNESNSQKALPYKHYQYSLQTSLKVIKREKIYMHIKNMHLIDYCIYFDMNYLCFKIYK
jgi:hypothetical protein